MADFTEDQVSVMVALYGACATVNDAYRMQLYKLRDEPPYVDGRVVTSLVRRGMVERFELEAPFTEPAYQLTVKGIEWVEALVGAKRRAG